jgi:hypothetical protein
LAISQDVARKDRILAAGRAESVFSFFTYDRIDFWHLHSQFVETKEDGSFEALLCGECATYVDDWNVDMVVVVLEMAVVVAAMAMTLTSKIFLVLNCRLKNAYFILCIKMPVYLVCYITSVNI